MSKGIHSIRFYNNTFISDGRVEFIRGKDNREVFFQGNSYLIA